MPSLTERFSPRPAATFLIRADRTTFRLDLRRRNERWEVFRLLEGAEIAPETSDESAPTNWVGPLLKAKRAAADIHILTTECRTHYTELPDAPRADQLPEILGLEAEQISGLPAGDFLLAHRAPRSSGAAPVYHFTWIEWERALSLRELARRHGYRLASIGHPGGFRLNGTAQLEDWPEVSLRLPGEGAEDPPQAWHGAEAAAEARAASNRYDAAPVLLDLSDATLREDWTQALVASLDRSAPTFAKHALVPIPEAPVSGGKQIAIGAAAGLVAALLVFAHYSVHQQKTADLREELAQLRAPREELAQLERERTALRRELNDLRRQGGSADQAAALFTRGPFIATLLDGLINGIDERSVVARLTAEAGVQRIEGITLHPEAPYALARHLASLPPLDSWEIHLESRTALLTHENGGPWAFVLWVGPPPPLPADATRRPARRR